MKNTIIDILIVLAIPLVLGGGYYYFQGSAPADSAVGVDQQLADKAKVISDDIQNLNGIAFDTTVFENMKYLKASRHEGETVQPGTFSRKSNPFVK